jgi:PAS domain S-box-containing protein
LQANDSTNKILESFFDSAPMLMGVVEITENDVYHVSDNKSSALFFGLDQNSMLGKLSSELGIQRESLDVWLEKFQLSKQKMSPVLFEWEHKLSHKTIYFAATVSYIGVAESGRPSFSYICQDITDDKLNRERLQRQEVFLEAILDNIPDMIFVKEAKDLRFVRMNRAGEELLGFPRENLIGKNDYDFFPKDEADYFTSKDREVMAKKKMLEIPIENIKTKFRGTRQLHTKKIPLLDKEGHPQYLVGISEDITEKILAEKDKQKMFQEQIARQEVEKSLQAKEEFISIASHELKSPISALKLQAQMFLNNIKNNKRDAFSLERVNKLIELTEREVSRLDRLVNDMLDASRITSGNLTMHFSNFNICKLISDVITKMSDMFGKAGYPIPELRCSNENIIGNWDSMRIEQVIINLLTNAFRYGKGRPIEVGVSQKENKVVIFVKDQGIGIDAVNLDRIFNRFERIIDKNEASGLGLGLFISKQIVLAHKGRIWAESELGKGSTFYLELPLGEWCQQTFPETQS